MMHVTKEFYSNCLIEAIKHKIRHPFKVKITYISPFINEVFCPHFMWSDGIADYDFGVNRELNWYEILCFKGAIRKRKLGFNENYKRERLEKWLNDTTGSNRKNQDNNLQ